jgi:hypothetical protein
MKARYAAAVATVFKTSDDGLCYPYRPGTRRRHVFDWPDGLRLVISRDQMPTGDVVVHFSCSFIAGSEMFLSAAAAEHPLTWFLDLAVMRFNAVSGYCGVILFGGFSEGKGIPHWYIPQKTRDAPRTARASAGDVYHRSAN